MKKIQKRILKKGAAVVRWSPEDVLLNEEVIGKAILECLLNNDPDGIVEVITAHLDAATRTK
jgi:hypothetical protein